MAKGKGWQIRSYGPYNFNDNLTGLVSDHVNYMLDRTSIMFEYEGLPDTIPKRYAERYIQEGVGIVKDYKDSLYIFGGGPNGSAGLGGELDEYYFPTIATIANPYIGLSGSFKIGKECEIIRNDPQCMGLIPLLTKYGTMISTDDVSIMMVAIVTRVQAIISAADDRTKKSAEDFISNLQKGVLSVIADNDFLDSLKTKDFMTSNGGQLMQNLVELRQYLKAIEYEELGLKTNYNMKREALNTSESTIDTDILRPFIDSMLEERQIGWDKVNKHYGTNISCKLASSWADNIKEINLTHEEMEAKGKGEEKEEKNADPEKPVNA